MRKKVIISILGLLVLALAGVLFYYNSVSKHPFKGKNQVIELTINKGDSLYSVLDELKDNNQLKNTAFIKAFIKINGEAGGIKPGNYSLSSELTLKELLQNISKGNDEGNLVRITIPEGYDIEKIAEVLQSQNLVSSEDFLKEVKAFELPSYITPSPEKRYALEGFLFPDTYEYKKDSTAKEIIEKMLQRFQEVIEGFEKELKIQIADSDMEKIIIIASMIEREARNSTEMPTIASVINNRINIGMKLQIDATVLYALGEHKEVVTYKDLEIDSPYNTYKINTLPIGAIASPGRDAILAAVKPSETNYIYYLFDPSSSKHFFTDNYNEFLQKKKEFGY